MRIATSNPGGGGISVVIYNVGEATPLGAATLAAPLSAGPTEIDVSFAGLSATIPSGIELWVTDTSAGNSQILYDATLTPTGLVIG